jgi:hypothetical protein
MESITQGSAPFRKPVVEASDAVASHRFAPPWEWRVLAWTRKLLVRRHALLGKATDAVRHAVVGGRANW